ncbi:hypothetical protein DICSQDRAFT_172019 [Dichomitus squalens LYAD-421 SS1]|uniref:DUF6533 domain-containing protein n=2 Tax=Dichomitus squalens TaxID=114155 RepID=A0A4Q9MGW2_9APHY|nr:uncharacterized protein DICSQDRAFT_172019 [Dichomitus squalens LYAD-421 SS1]EJF59418.1 hypothetical protein DICSQDRAFT_172019 [Dichomitus squalens LYAD-421 SS1]TBU26700.1 hypothetical protein BD311DRAFT_667016 [Dichomitus squalens]
MATSGTGNIVALLQTNSIMNFVIVATATLVGFDHLITFQQELELFWSRRLNLSCMVFFFNRYVAVIYYVAMVPIRFFPSVTQEYGPFISQPIATELKQSPAAL